MFHVKHSGKLFLKLIEINNPDTERCRKWQVLNPRTNKKAPQICEGLFYSCRLKLRFNDNYELIRSWYSFDSVLTSIFSPCLIKSGTRTTRPVSVVMGFVAPETVSPFT